MRHVLKLTASALLASSVLAIGPAFAGNDEAHQDSFWANQATSTQGGAAQGYMKMDPRDAKADSNAGSGVDQADASNAYFNHAEGTMTTPNAVAPSQSSNGQYVATYHQYMQVEPRDQKVQDDSASATNKDIYLYHSMGTMSAP